MARASWATVSATLERWRWPIVGAAWALFTLAFFALQQRGIEGGPLAAIPVIVTAWLFGLWGAIGGSVAMLVALTIFGPLSDGRPFDLAAAFGQSAGPTGLVIGVVLAFATAGMRWVFDQLVRTRARIAEEEARMRAILETSFDGFGVHRDGIWLDMTPSVAQLFGRERRELIGRPLADSIALADRPRLRERIEKRRGEPERFRALTRDGREIIILLSAADTTFRGRPARGFAIRDVTEQENARVALAESEQRFRQIADAIGAAVWLQDASNHALLYVSPGYERVWGRSVASLEAAPRSWIDAVLPGDRPAVEAYQRAQLEGETDVQYRIRAGNGSVRWIHDHAFPVRDAAGRVVRVVGIAEDITPIKQIEERLRQASGYARALFESSIDPVATLSLDGRVVDANRALEAATGAPRDALVGRELASFFHEADAFRGAIVTASSRGVVRDQVVTLGPPDEERSFLVNGTLMQDERSSERVVLVAARDITERLRLEGDAAAQREAMGRAERLSSLGTLVAGVAHEINNPLTYLQGNIELALLDVADAKAALAAGGVQGGPDLDETARELAAALGGAERIGHITKALKSVARQRRSGASGEDVRLNAVVSNVAALLDAATPDGIVVECAYDASDPVVRATSAELHQVVLNLAQNAIEALSRRGGHVWIETRVVDDHAEIEVRDDGAGIPPDVQAKLFTPFFTTKAQGTGLGLSIVHGLVHDQGGEIIVRSEPGDGASFLVRLPLVRRGAPDAPTTTPAA